MRWTCGMLATICAWVLSGAGPVAQKPPLKNPYEGNADAIRNGMGYYRSRCADCHGIDARGVRAPDLTQVWASGRTDEGLFNTVRRGVPDTEMPAFVPPRNPDVDIWQVARVPAHAFGARANRSAARQRRERREDLPRELRRLPPRRRRRRTPRAGPVARRRRTGARHHRRPHSPRARGIRCRLRAGHDHAARGPPIRGVKKNEDMFSVQVMDTTRANPGVRQGEGEGGQRHTALADAGLRPRSPERQRPRRSPPLPAHPARIRAAPFRK